MRNWYEDYALRIKPPVFNCTANGIPIAGIENKKFSDFVYSAVDIDSIVDDAYYKEQSTEPNYIDLQAIRKVNEELISELDIIKATVTATNSITPEMSQTRAWRLLDEFVSAVVYLQEIRAEFKIANNQSTEAALKHYASVRTKFIVE